MRIRQNAIVFFSKGKEKISRRLELDPGFRESVCVCFLSRFSVVRTVGSLRAKK